MLCHLLSCPLTCTGIPSRLETALPIYSKNIEFLQRHSSHALGPARPALRPSGPFRVCAVDRFERLASPQTQKCRRAAQLAMNTASWRAPARTTCDDSACRMGVACKLAGDGAPLPRRKRPYCNARKGNELPPPEERPEYRQVARAAVEKQPQESLRLALRFRDEPDAVAAESANSSARRTCG